MMPLSQLFPNRKLTISRAVSCGVIWAAWTLVIATAYAEDTVKIVSSLPRTGSSNGQTTSMVNGIRMALEEVGFKAGGMKIAYEDWDDASPARGAWDPALEAQNAERAVKDPAVLAYIGPYNSGAAKISMPKLNQAGVLMVNPSATAAGLTKSGLGEPNEPLVYRPSGKINFFRVVAADDLQGALGANWAKELGATKVYILHDGEVYGQGIAQVFREEAKKIGLDVVGYDAIEIKASNYRSIAIKMKQSGADLVFFGGTTQSNAGQVAKDIRAVGFKAKFMVPDGCFESAFIQAAGAKNLEGTTFITFAGIPPQQLTGKGQEFYENYKKKYGVEPEGYAAYGYESAKVAITAIEKVGKNDRAAVLAAATGLKDFNGILGTWSFNDQGDTNLTRMSGNIVENGQFKFAKILSLEPNK